MKKLVMTAIASIGLLGVVSTAQADGQKTYQTACFACHGTGAAGAPKLLSLSRNAGSVPRTIKGDLPAV